MRFSRHEQNSVEYPILPSPRSLFPEIFRENHQINVPSFKPQSPFHANFDKFSNHGFAQKHNALNIFGCCEVGCNCDANILGGSTKSPSEICSSPSSLSPTPSSPEGFNYLRQIHEQKRRVDDCGLDHFEHPSTKIYKSDSGSKPFGLKPDTDKINRNIKRPFPLLTGPSKSMPTTVRKPYQCTFCAKRFARPSSLKTHTYSHTGEKPFVCLEEGCHSQFSVLSNLRRHAKLHASMKGETVDAMKNYS